MNTTNPWVRNLSRHAWSAMSLIAALTVWAAPGASSGLAQHATQPTFSSAGDASDHLFRVVRDNNVHAIANILGGRTELTSPDNEVQDKGDRELFVRKYREMHRLGRESNGSLTLYIGAENWPFPVPLVQTNGVWRFDPDSGSKEVLFRRIGENELTAIDICHEFAATTKKYRDQPNTVIPANNFSASLVARAAGPAINPAGAGDSLFQGYYFHIISAESGTGARLGTSAKKAEGLSVIAYPAKYRSSGVMTFIISNDVVYQKDLGANTSNVARATTVFHLDGTWHVADQ
jgi:Protein of unknown function (DUF2950)